MQHTETRIYQRSLELVALSGSVVNDLPQGYAFLGDQLRRASCSVLLNFSEGFGKRTKRDRQRFFSIARGSALEVAAAVDAAFALGATSQRHRDEARDLSDHVAAMLYKFR